jgi:hypothetical protein
MPEETVVLPIRLTRKDLDVLTDQADKAGMEVSVFARTKLAELTPGLTGKVNKQGGARRGAGRPPRKLDSIAV